MKSIFIKNIMLLAGGTASAQLINILFLPLLTRLYGPSEFGVYAVIIAINAVLTVFCTFKYENAIVSVKTDTRARLTAIMLFKLVLINSSILLIVSLISMQFIEHEVEMLTTIIIASFLSIVFGSWYQILYFWNNRYSVYGVMSKSRLLAVLSMTLFSVSYGYAYGDVKGLLYGNVISLAVNFVYLLFCGENLFKGMRAINFKYSLMVAWKLINFPKYLVVSSILDRVASQVHLFLFTHFYSSAVSGALGLHNRVISLPSSIICNAVGDVFKRQASESLKSTGQCYHLFMKTALSLFFIGSPIALVLLFFAPDLFVFIFGADWRSAGEISQILACNFWLAFVVSPISNLIYLEDNQRYDFILQLLLLVMLATSMGFAIYYFDMITAVWAFAISYMVKYIIEFIICLRIALGPKCSVVIKTLY